MIQTSEIDFKDLIPLIDQESITDIMYHKNEVWIDDLIKGHYRSSVEMNDDSVKIITNQLAQKMKTNFNASQPILDAETDSLRINAIHQELSPDGIVFTVRKTPQELRLNDEYLLQTGYLTSPVLELLKKCVRARLNIIIAGETGAGKTELLKYLVQFIKEHERIITIEDTLESRLKRIYNDKDIVSLKINYRHDYSDLIKTSLRQRPDWILVSESRGEEVNDLLNSIASGHSIITTIHAMSARDIPDRMLSMMNKNELSERDKALIYHYLDIGIYVRKIQKDGIHRKIVEIIEFINENGKIKTKTLFESCNDEYVIDCLSDSTRRKMYVKTDGCEYI